MSAAPSRIESGDESPPSQFVPFPRQSGGRVPDSVALQLDLATEAALAGMPEARVAMRSAAGQALEASIERHLTEGGLTDIARRYRACRRRRALDASTLA